MNSAVLKHMKSGLREQEIAEIRKRITRAKEQARALEMAKQERRQTGYIPPGKKLPFHANNAVKLLNGILASIEGNAMFA